MKKLIIAGLFLLGLVFVGNVDARGFVTTRSTAVFVAGSTVAPFYVTGVMLSTPPVNANVSYGGYVLLIDTGTFPPFAVGKLDAFNDDATSAFNGCESTYTRRAEWIAKVVFSSTTALNPTYQPTIYTFPSPVLVENGLVICQPGHSNTIGGGEVTVFTLPTEGTRRPF